MGTLHRNLTGANLHVPGYVTDTDPGAVGAGMLWIDTSGGTGNWAVKIRNPEDDNWEGAGGGFDPSPIEAAIIALAEDLMNLYAQHEADVAALEIQIAMGG